MRGIGVFEFGGPEVLRVVDLPEKHATAGEVRIRVHASTVNPTDTYLRKGARADALRNVLPPYVPGMDVAGVIDEIGAGTVTSLAIGAAVMAMVVNHASHGGYRESIVLPVDAVVRAPAGVTLIEADVADEWPHGTAVAGSACAAVGPDAGGHGRGGVLWRLRRAARQGGRAARHR